MTPTCFGGIPAALFASLDEVRRSRRSKGPSLSGSPLSTSFKFSLESTRSVLWLSDRCVVSCFNDTRNSALVFGLRESTFKFLSSPNEVITFYRKSLFGGGGRSLRWAGGELGITLVRLPNKCSSSLSSSSLIRTLLHINGASENRGKPGVSRSVRKQPECPYSLRHTTKR
jgi:hypothetical protein